MPSSHIHYSIELLVVLLLIATATAMCVKWIKVPYSIALVIVGLVIGVLQILPPIQMTPELILVAILPALLFEASWNLPLGDFKRNLLPIGVLATIGVIVSTIVTAGILHYLSGMNLNIALLLGAVVAATDPISVLSIFKQQNVDGRLSTLVEGESLFNDGTAVVLFRLLLASVIAGSTASPVGTLFSFVIVVAGGLLIGLLIGFLACKVTSLFDDHLLETMLTTIVAYGSYLLSESIGVSGVIAVVVAGMVFGNFGSRTGMSATTRIAVDSFWEYAAFAVNSLVFLLIGLQVKLDLLLKYSPIIGVGILAVLVSRAVIVYGLCPLLSSKKNPLPYSWRHVLFWGGLRGSLSMAMALSLPNNFPMRETVVISTFGIVLFTLLIPGLSVEPLIKRLRLTLEAK